VTAAQRKLLIIVVICTAVVAIVAMVVQRAVAPREYTIRTATITAIDAATRTGTIEFVHPKSGQKMSVTASIPPESPITINGAPGRFEDVHIGDQIEARGRYAMGRTTALSVKVTRSTAATGPAPATTPAGTPAGSAE
jgi:hypothetical protein